MGRTQKFDEQAALDSAMLLFWRQGYANTSIKQLLAATALLNGSFYYCFKDKKTAFIKSLDHYNEKITYKRQEALAKHDDFSVGIRALFKEIFTVFENSDMPNGCLIVNSMTEEVLCIDALKTYLHKDFSCFVQFMTERVQRSIDLGYTVTEGNAEELAYIIATYIQGVFRVSNTATTVMQLTTQTEYFLHALKL